MKIIYFPGFGGNQNSETFKSILYKFSESKAIIYDNVNAENAFQQIQKQIKNQLSAKPLIIGQSLGGFWAEYFAITYNLNLILINPSIEPYESLKKYNLSSSELNSFRKFESNEYVKSKISIILSKNDTVVNPKSILEKYKKIVKFIYVEGDHKFTDFDLLISEIEKMID